MVNQTDGKTGSVTRYFLITFAFSWFFWLVGVLASQNVFTLPFPVLVLVVVGAHGPLVAALGLTWAEKGWAGVKALLRSGFQLRLPPVWWLFILLVPAVLGGLAAALNVSLSDFLPDTTLLSQPLLILPTFLFMFFLGGSFREEFGWRGYALPRLLKKWSPLAASLILGAIWGFWHLPLFFIDGVSQSYMPFGVFLLLTICFSILFTWIYLRTRGNLFGALLLHTALNTVFSLFPPIELKAGGNQAALTYLMIFYFLVSVGVVMKERRFWLKTTPGSLPVH